MSYDFRFLVICQGASHRAGEHHVMLNGIVNELRCAADEPVELVALVSALLHPKMQGKSLALMVGSLGRTPKLQPLDGYVGTPLILPAGMGPQVLPYPITLPIRRTGLYCFQLFDPNGLFGTRDGLLANFVFSAVVA